MDITIETRVKADLSTVWAAWNNPQDIQQWNAASGDWHTTQSAVDLREGGKFSSRMEAKDGSAGFDFEGTYTRIVPRKLIEYRLGDGRQVKVEFAEGADGVLVRETFERSLRTSRSCSAKAGRRSSTISPGMSKPRTLPEPRCQMEIRDIRQSELEAARRLLEACAGLRPCFKFRR